MGLLLLSACLGCSSSARPVMGSESSGESLVVQELSNLATAISRGDVSEIESSLDRLQGLGTAHFSSSLELLLPIWSCHRVERWAGCPIAERDWNDISDHHLMSMLEWCLDHSEETSPRLRLMAVRELSRHEPRLGRIARCAMNDDDERVQFAALTECISRLDAVSGVLSRDRPHASCVGASGNYVENLTSKLRALGHTSDEAVASVVRLSLHRIEHDGPGVMSASAISIPSGGAILTGELVVELNGKSVNSLKQFVADLAEVPEDRVIPIKILRGRPEEVDVRVGDMKHVSWEFIPGR
ncbi:MAG: serine protease [Planctomycetia bacterium]|nr:serine protease [Planctomycetia bacterium]